MDGFPLVIFLPLLTFALVLVYIVWSKRRTEQQLDGEIPHDKSSLAKDGPGPQPIRRAGETS